jgi:hypothetical protein
MVEMDDARSQQELARKGTVYSGAGGQALIVAAADRAVPEFRLIKPLRKLMRFSDRLSRRFRNPAGCHRQR